MIITLNDLNLIATLLEYEPNELYDKLQELITLAEEFESVEITIKLTNPIGS